MSNKTRLWGMLTLWFAMVGIASAQQTTGDILGTVTDSSGAVVLGATVTVENLGTQEKRTAQTSGAGDYVVNLLKPGNYSVTVSANGFKAWTVPSLTLAAGDRTRVDAHLTVGSSVETITVEAQPSALQTDSSVLGSTISEKTTQDLPLNGRNFVQLTQLAPGANEGPPTSLIGGSSLDDLRQTAAISVNGQSDILNNQTIDGADNNERLIGTIAVRPSVEAIAEMHIQTNTYTADVGRTAGGVVNIITRSGTNNLHGSLFEYFRNDILDANTYNFGQTLPKSELRQNQYGGSIGGPIVKDKTFFFGDYEGYRLIKGLAPQVITVPTLFEEQHPGNFSDVGGPVIPSSAIDPVGLDYFSMYPAPNSGTNQFIKGSQEIQYSTVFDVRVDHQFNPKNIMYARFIYNNVYTNEPGPFPDVTVSGLTLNPNFIGYGFGSGKDVDYNGLLNYVHIFNSDLLLELKAAYTRSDNGSTPSTIGQNPNAAFGQPNVNTPISDSTGLAPIVVITGANLGQVLFQPLRDQDNTFQYAGAVAYTRGAHNFKFGAALIRRQLTSFQSNEPEGLWIFIDYPGLLQGQYVNTQRSLQLAPPHLRVWEPSVYAQDDWRVSKRLTLNLGLRYDVFTPFTETHNQISTFDHTTGALLVAGQNGVSTTAGIKTDYRGLAPRIGFAATVGKGLVVRGGYGISFFPMNTTSGANLKNPPFVATVASCGFFNCGPGFTTFADGFPAPAPSNITSPGSSIPVGVDPHYRTSYVEQFNLTVEKDWAGNVLGATYVGIVGRDLLQFLPDLNAPPPNACGNNPACFNPLRPYFSVDPNLETVGFAQTHGKSSYNALQLSLERRLKNGLAVNANYQYAHNLDNAAPLVRVGNGYGAVPSEVGTLDYGNSYLDIRHRLAATATYELPFGKGSTGAKAVFAKGWQFNVISVWQTGQPFSVTNATDISNTEPGAMDADRPNLIGNPNLPNPDVKMFFNTGAFAAQAPGTIGSEGRNILHGPHFRHTDLSLFKVFPIAERYNLEFRVECFNLSNTTNFGPPNSSLGGVAFGQLTNVIGDPREFQFALKFRF